MTGQTRSAYLALIPARGGSKGIVDKNLQPVGDTPLIGLAVRSALDSAMFERIVVSTDSERIAEVGREHGAQVPFLRPAELADDKAPTIDAVKHAVDHFERQGERFEAVVLLQPTCPFRSGLDIRRAVSRFEDGRKAGARCLISVCDATGSHPRTMYKAAEGELLQPFLDVSGPMRRQDFQQVWIRNGAIYIADRDLIMRDNLVYDDNPAFYEMPRDRSVNIDEPLDLTIANMMARAGLVAQD